MPGSPFDHDGNHRPAPDHRSQQRYDAAARLEMRASPPADREPQPAEETIEEPGYGHGV